MPRRENGRRAVWTARLSEAEAAAADAICEKTGESHSAWLQDLVRMAIAGQTGPGWVSNLEATIADLEAELEQADRHAGACRSCGTPLACPSCQRGDDWA
jgi:hypothetical protein